MYVSDRWIMLLTFATVVSLECRIPAVQCCSETVHTAECRGRGQCFLHCVLKPCSESVCGNMRTRGMHLACTRQLLVQCIYVLGHDIEVLEECI